MTTFQVGASSDDVDRNVNAPSFSLVGTAFAAGKFDEANKQYGGGARFANITIPKGSTIDSAVLTIRALTNDAGTTCNTRISAEAVDDAVTFADNATTFDTRWANRGTPVDWDGVEAFTANNNYNSPDIKAVIQAITDRAGWASGQAIVIFWEDYEDRSTLTSGAPRRRCRSWDSSTEFAPKLVITWTEPSGRGWLQK